jgi:plasmid stabilization system protein ParE
MAYRVDISPSALQDAEDAYLWVKYHSAEKAGEWYEGLLRAVFSLEKSPRRCAVAPESRDLGREVRQLLYGSRRNAYRILFGIGADAQSGEKVVRVYRIRHASRRRIRVEEIAEGEEEGQGEG